MTDDRRVAGDAERPAAPARSRRKAPPEPPSTILKADAAFAAKAKDLEALRTAVVDAAAVGAGLWFSYIFVLLYLFIATGSVTHKDLFLQSPIRLPFLNIELPLLGFFGLAPMLFLVVHGYVLLHFVLLAGKVGTFHTTLEARLKGQPDNRTGLRQQLPSNLFVQILAGPREMREGAVGVLLRLVAQISLVAGPVALLIFLLLQFLPYHHPWITWLHRAAIVTDLVLLWLLWPSVARGRLVRSKSLFRLLRWSRSAQAMAGLCCAVLLLVFPIATFPGEALHRLPAFRFIPTDAYEILFDRENLSWTSPHTLLIDGEIDYAARAPKSLWSNRIVLPGIDIIDHAKFDTEAKIAALPATVSLRRRNLDGAVLIGATLRKADFTGSRLQGAQLDQADLRGSKFECGQIGKDCAALQGASFDEAQLQGASLVSAQLQGASFDEAQLQGALLNSAQLQGASLNGAQLQGASLDFAQLQGASLDFAQLQGAWLDNAQLQGASFNQAELRGASLYKVQFQGTSLNKAKLQGALFDNAFIWRSDIHDAETRLTLATDLIRGPVSSRQFENLKHTAKTTIPEGPKQNNALKRIEILNPSIKPNDQEAKERAWIDLKDSPPNADEFMKIATEQFRLIGCANSGSPYVLHQLIERLRAPYFNRIFWTYGIWANAVRSKYFDALAAYFLNEDCIGAKSIAEEDRVVLKSRPWDE